MLEIMATTNDGSMSVLALTNAVCKHLPEGWQIHICMENGSAYVDLYDPRGHDVDLPDQADKTLEQQVNDALCVANGFHA